MNRRSTAIRRLRVPALVWALLVVVSAACGAPQGLSDPGKLQSLMIETGRTVEGQFLLDGPDASQQLVVTGVFSSGQQRDLTRTIRYEVRPTEVVEVTPSGFVLPRADGLATITATTTAGVTAQVRVRVTNLKTEKPLNFERHIQPILTRYGCNNGSCHGKAGGQKGFALSLHGFEMRDDYERIVCESRGRRVFPAHPETSLLLTKPLGKVGHGGGVRFKQDFTSYRVLRRWLVQGMPFGNATDPQVSRIEVIPAARMMPLRGEQQLAVVAHYTDGSTEDVTAMAYYEANTKELVQASPSGLVATLGYTGSASVMVRYQGHVATFRAPVPLGAPVDRLPPAKNFIDELVFKHLKSIGLPPSDVCSDEVFVRRVTLDIAGRLPTPAETVQFLADTNAQKRDRWIDHLLARPEHADYFARKWTLLLRSRVDQTNQVRGSIAVQQWLREAIYHNKPYDEIVTELLTASGEQEDNPLVNWWRQIKDQSDQVESTAQVFLGVRLQCARCHHHPFDQWSQEDYYGLAAFFSRVGRKYGKEYQGNVERIYHKRGVPSVPHPRTKAPILPTGLGGKPLNLSPDDDPREALAQWMTAPENPYFSRALVNRYWKHFFGRGLVDPEDDMRATNPASHPELLDALARHFVKSRFDLKDLVRTICQSRVYQLSTEANAFNLEDRQHHARFYPRRMMAEVLLDSIDDVLMTKSNLGGAPPLPPEARAVQLPHFPYPSQYFLQIFGTPEGSTSCECERIDTANLAQNLHLMNSAEVLGKVSSASGRAATLSADASLSSEQKLRKIFLLVYSRNPKPRELERALRHLSRAKNRTEEKAALEDLLWALINTKEFMYNH
jgi:hypothetical protein